MSARVRQKRAASTREAVKESLKISAALLVSGNVFPLSQALGIPIPVLLTIINGLGVSISTGWLAENILMPLKESSNDGMNTVRSNRRPNKRQRRVERGDIEFEESSDSESQSSISSRNSLPTGSGSLGSSTGGVVDSSERRQYVETTRTRSDSVRISIGGVVDSCERRQDIESTPTRSGSLESSTGVVADSSERQPDIKSTGRADSTTHADMSAEGRNTEWQDDLISRLNDSPTGSGSLSGSTRRVAVDSSERRSAVTNTRPSIHHTDISAEDDIHSEYATQSESPKETNNEFVYNTPRKSGSSVRTGFSKLSPKELSKCDLMTFCGTYSKINEAERSGLTVVYREIEPLATHLTECKEERCETCSNISSA